MNYIGGAVVTPELAPYVDTDVHFAYANDTVGAISARLNANPEKHAASQWGDPLAVHAVVQPHLHEQSEVDPSYAVVMPFPLGVALDRNMFMHAEYTANNMPGGANVLAFTGQSLRATMLYLPKEQRDRVAKGDNTPITDSQCRAIEALGFESIDIVGKSHGAPQALELARIVSKIGVADVGGVIALDAANTAERTNFELAKAFIAAGKDLNKTIQDNGLQPYIDIRNADPGVITWLKQQGGFALYAAGLAFRRNNHAFIESLKHDTAAEQISRMLESTTAKLHYGRFENSTISPADSFDRDVKRFKDMPGFNSFVIPDRNHDGCDQIVEAGALIRQKFTGLQAS